MKPICKLLLHSTCAAMLVASPEVLAQDPYAGSYDVTNISSRMPEYRQGEMIVKFKTETTTAPQLKASKGRLRAAASAKALNSLLEKYGASEAEELMPLTGAQVTPKARRARAFDGKTVDDSDLSSLYLIRLDRSKTTDIHAVASDFAALPEVEYAEPNYILRICATASDYTSEPMYGQQWGVPAIKLDKLWEKPVINSKRPVIAILDTGVDIEHPDLADNIWTNEREANGIEDSDDDGNGFTDDIHGWDFINNTGLMRDNNGHGTHCAGIAAASGSNGIGITGANPDALILPVTVMQSDGSGDVATIARGVDYACAQGADVLSLSLGTYTHSLSFYDILAKAYQKSLIVGAAGNDGMMLIPPPMGAPFFPAAYTFVVGVMASDTEGNLAPFSNYDPDGPISSAFSNSEMLYEYEIKAPGTNIISTYPGGGYRSLNGTSMACPLVAGALSRLYQCKDIPTKEILFGDMIHTLQGGLDGVLDVNAIYGLRDSDRVPTLGYVGCRIDDTAGGDGDFRPDAGEILEIYPTVRNFWGQARNVRATVELYGENEDRSIIDIIDGEADFGSEISGYAHNESKNPLRIKINDNCADGRHITLRLTISCDNSTNTVEALIPLVVENGIELSGLIWQNTTLYPDKYYIVTTNIGVCEGVTLTLMPGTKLHFRPGTGISVEPGEPEGQELYDPITGQYYYNYPNAGKVIAKGTPDKRILFTAFGSIDQTAQSDVQFNFGPNSELEYVEFNNFSCTFSFQQNRKYPSFRKTLFNYLGISDWYPKHIYINESAIYNCTRGLVATKTDATSIVRNYTNPSFHSTYINVLPGVDKIRNCNTFGNIYEDYSERNYISISEYSDKAIYKTTDEPNYYGSANRDILRNWIWDIRNPKNTGWTWSPRSFAELDLSNMLTRPNPAAPGVVWKVEIDGINACDDFDILPDLGVGRHKVEVFFSKRMNRDKTPMVAMGVRPPYTQIPISEDASWRTEVIDGDELDVYTAYLTIRGRDTYDGLNRIYVGDAEDEEFFPIPVEDFRFHANVQSAGSMSAGFMAEAGVGRVKLTWESPADNIDDMLGYNLYRYRPDVLNDEGQPADTVRINAQLIEKEEFTDYDIEPGNTYCYFYKVLRTSLTENSPSRVVSATPRAAGKGDSDGSGAVDVADVVTDVNYMVGREPRPFIFDAADVNSDSRINILDVVGTVNIIMTPDKAPAEASLSSVAVYTVENGILYIDTPVELAGLQLTLSGDRSTGEIKVLAGLKGMETTGRWMNDSEYRFLSFSLSGHTIAAGRTALLSIGSNTVEDIMLVSPDASQVAAIRGDLSGISEIVMQQMLVPSPNPFDDVLEVPVTIGTEGNHSVQLSLSSLVGVRVLGYDTTLGYGQHKVTLDTTAVPTGFYLLTLTVDGTSIQSCKVVKTDR